MNTIRLIGASLLAIGLAWLWDRLLTGFGFKQQIRVGFLVPIGEELIKVVFFYSLSLPPILFYGLFGLGEGLLESFIVPKRFKIVILLAGCITHLIFSLFFLTAFPIYIQLLFAISAHIWWNYKFLALGLN